MLNFNDVLEAARAITFEPISIIADGVKTPQPARPYVRQLVKSFQDDNMLLTWDPSIEALRPFVLPSYLIGGDLVRPGQWQNYRDIHTYHNPSCFCPLLHSGTPLEFQPSSECRLFLYQPNSNKPDVYWTLACNAGACGYFLVNILKVFNSPNQPTAPYPVRPQYGLLGYLVPPWPEYRRTADSAPRVNSKPSTSRSLKRSNAVLLDPGSTSSTPSSSQTSPAHKKVNKGKAKAMQPTVVPPSDPFRDLLATVVDSDHIRSLQLLLELDRNGLLPNEFNRVMLICGCGLMMTRDAYQATHFSRCNGQHAVPPADGADIFGDVAIANPSIDGMDDYQQLLLLDNHLNPGLTLAHARILIVRCKCSRYMTRSTFESNLPHGHHCPFKPHITDDELP